MTIIELATIAMIAIYVATILLIVANDRRAYLVLEAKALEDQMQKESLCSRQGAHDAIS